MSQLRYLRGIVRNGIYPEGPSPMSLWQSLLKVLAESDVASFSRFVSCLSEHIYTIRVHEILHQWVPNVIMHWAKKYCFCLFQTLSNHFTQYHLLLQLDGEWSLPISLLHAALPLAGLLCSLFSFSYSIWNTLVPRLVFLLKVKVIPYGFCCLSNSRVSFLKQHPSACSEGVAA